MDSEGDSNFPVSPWTNRLLKQAEVEEELGVILFVLLCQRPPFRCEADIIDEAPKLPTDLDQDLSELLAHMLTKVPLRRVTLEELYQDVSLTCVMRGCYDW
jgi:hypothetical protein